MPRPLARRGARVVESDGLENRCTFTGTVGSNPTLSAIVASGWTQLGERVFVLHAFQKKSKRGIATPQVEIDLIKRRLKLATEISKAKE
jgi:hypothetical protein